LFVSVIKTEFVFRYAKPLKREQENGNSHHNKSAHFALFKLNV
jgi:hypothetical protein